MAKTHNPKTNGQTHIGTRPLGAAAIIAALNNPLRREILVAFREGETSPRELADLLAKPLSNVSYHIRALVDFGILDLVRTKQVRGAMQHFYVSREPKDEQLRAIMDLSGLGEPGSRPEL